MEQIVAELLVSKLRRTRIELGKVGKVSETCKLLENTEQPGIAHEKLTVDWQMSDCSDRRTDSWTNVENSAENSNWPPSRK